MNNEKTIVVKKKDFTIEPFGSIVIGDPYYLEKINQKHKDTKTLKKLVYINHAVQKAHRDAKVRLAITQTVVDGDIFDNIELIIASVDNTDQKVRDALLKVLLDNRYHKSLLSKNVSLGCDTAKFYINVDGNDEEIHTGADGYYGNAVVYKNKLAYCISIVLDSELHSETNIEQLIRYLFHVESEEEWV